MADSIASFELETFAIKKVETCAEFVLDTNLLFPKCLIRQDSVWYIITGSAESILHS